MTLRAPQIAGRRRAFRVIPVSILCLMLALVAMRSLDRWIGTTELPATLTDVSIEVLDRDGDLLRAYPVEDGIWRMDLTLAQVDPTYLDMLIAYEDRRFYAHAGVDLRAIFRAGAQAVWHGRVVSGGSTLTMQLARLLEDGTTGAWAGKWRQTRLALALERHLSKDQILRLYLIHAPYGGNIEGLRAASYLWFGKPPNRLSVAEAALLISLPQSPEGRRPDRAAKVARDARGRVLDRMQAQGILDAEAVALARQAALPRQMARMPQLAPHLTDRARGQNPGRARIALTVDAALQRRLEALVTRAAVAGGEHLSAALMVADHQTGEILASVGSAGYGTQGRQGFVDMTRALRSPGSTLKPLVYGMGFDQGLVHPETLIHDGPVDFEGYAPQNFDGIFRGDLRIREALQLSLNIPVVKLTRELGPARLMARLRKAGAAPVIPGRGRAGLAISLGGVGMRLEGLVQLYAGLAALGQGPGLRFLQEDSPTQMPRVLSPVAAWQVGEILRRIPPPPGARAGVLAYKTGTSYGHRDAWALGWDGRHVIGVWLGRADGTPVPGAFGGDLAAPILFEAFGRLKSAFEPLPSAPPATLTVATADLPARLQRFAPRDAAFVGDAADAPQLLFPPNGARLELEGQDLTIKLRGGHAPFTVFANGVPVVTGATAAALTLPNPGAGFSHLSVVDARGRAAAVTVQIDTLQVDWD